MDIRRYFHLVCILALMMVSGSALAQYYTTGDDPGKARWRQIKSENYIFIYPQEIDSLARK